MKPKSKPTTRAARFAAAEKALKESNDYGTRWLRDSLAQWGDVSEVATPRGTGTIRWTPGQLHSMGLL